MTSAAVTVTGRTARLVLLLATALGLALMHTLGHAGVRGDAHPATTGMHAPAVVGGTAAFTEATACPGGHCGDHGPGVWSVCLAILTGMVVLMMLLWLAGAGHRRSGRAAAATRRVSSPRAPPDAPAGLRLTSVAVLRI
ncbi:DUF6153 family protein [Catenuloplanes indicus]|uniref:Uncharacterized protein n=1 Tax=Catenuloplanes indicus TaxID=137267 RepID=A0AAE4AUM3_9ACTN|nr:DUF6153 family protein [Catenuloplanes indicus]MDQ0363915.1 hypothetical protein [Catenuloplanes indicus]